jgi:DNA-binding CsgD family transcriptional regulator
VGSTNFVPIIKDYFRSPIPDPREDRVSPRQSDQFMPDFAYFSKQEVAKDPYYQEFLASHGLAWNATAALGRDLLICLRRGKKCGPYEGADLSMLNRSLPALRSASRIASLTWRSGFSGRLSAFERLGRGALLLDATGRVLEANRCVQFGDGLDVIGGYLKTNEATGRAALQRLLATVSLSSHEALIVSATTLALRRRSALRPLVLDAMVCTDAMRSLHSRAILLVIVTDLDRQVHLPDSLLNLVFGLTVTEAKVARLLTTGHSLREVSVHLGISEGHARQRLKSIFAKTGTDRQGALIALLAKLGNRGATRV